MYPLLQRATPFSAGSTRPAAHYLAIRVFFSRIWSRPGFKPGAESADNKS
jgi:hypothetical protein